MKKSLIFIVPHVKSIGLESSSVSDVVVVVVVDVVFLVVVVVVVVVVLVVLIVVLVVVGAGVGAAVGSGVPIGINVIPLASTGTGGAIGLVVEDVLVVFILKDFVVVVSSSSVVVVDLVVDSVVDFVVCGFFGRIQNLFRCKKLKSEKKTLTKSYTFRIVAEKHNLWYSWRISNPSLVTAAVKLAPLSHMVKSQYSSSKPISSPQIISWVHGRVRTLFPVMQSG